MRDQNHTVTKVEFSLDSRKMLMLFAGGVVVVALFFSLGVMVGKRLGGVAKQPGAPESLENVVKQEQTYKQHQTELAQAVEKQPPEPAMKTEKNIEKPAAPKKEDEKKAVEVKPAPSEKKAVELKPAETPKPKKAPPEKKAEAPKPKPKAAEPVKEKKISKAATKTIAKTETPAPEGQVYAIQISSLGNQANAQKFVSNYKPFDSRKPYIVEVNIPGKGTWYRIKIGRFKTKEQALAYQSIFEAKKGIKNTILALD